MTLFIILFFSLSYSILFNNRREERREADGTIVGKYGYIDPNGEERVVEYRADPENFSASGAIGPDNAALRFSQAQQSSASRDAARAMSDWNKAAGRSAAIQSAQPQRQITRQQAAPSWRPAQPSPVAAPQQAQPQAAPVVPSAAIPANWPPAIPTWENLPRQQQPLVQPQANWANTANTAQWNSAWSNFNWNENNNRVMADWNAPAVQAAPRAPVVPQPQPQANWNVQPQQPRPVAAAAPIQPASAPAGVVSGPNGAWNMFSEIDHADGGLRRAQISPVAAFRNQQIQQQAALPQAPAQPQWAQWPQGTNNGFARRTGSARSTQQQTRSQVRSQPAPTVVSQDPFSFSFGVDHSS